MNTKSKVLSALEIVRIRQMRMEDPDKWTVRALAAKFGVGKSLIGALINAHREDTSFRRLGRKCPKHGINMTIQTEDRMICHMCEDEKHPFRNLKF